MAHQTGDAVKLFQTLLSTTWYGIVSDADTPPMMSATMEAVDGEAVITTDVLVGPKGDKGDPAPIVELNWPAPDSPVNLPTNWGQNKKNHGYLIGGMLYVWTGYKWETALPGPAGPAGATPQLTVTCETIPMDERTEDTRDEVLQSGTSTRPHLHLRLLSPQGPQGPSTNISGAPDYDGSQQAKPGKVLTVLPNNKWGPSDFATRQPRLYSIPEQAFHNFTGLSQRHTILSFNIEPQSYDWVPYVTGKIKAFGVELDADPLVIGCEVRLGAPTTGQLIGRGFGNISNWATITPHFSTSGSPTDAVAPDNGVALVKAGVQATISVNLYNDGLLGAYIFNRSGAQLTVLTIPHG